LEADGAAGMQILDRLNIPRRIGLLTKIGHDNPGRFEYTNLLSFLLVTHTISSDTRFNGYEFLKWTVVLKQFWTDRQLE
jgi:hypothetical protein